MLDQSCVVAFTPSVRAEQERYGSRRQYARYEAAGGFRTALDEATAAFVGTVDTAFLATVNADGRPYVQHRGGPAGFIRVAAPDRLLIADREGNRQYVTTGNLRDNAKAFLFLIDYENLRRVKIWGEAAMREPTPELRAALGPEGDDPGLLRVLEFRIEALDVNCPKFIPRKIGADKVLAAVHGLQDRIRALEEENAVLRAANRFDR
ncbi:pyridoxamine 5'-phosphate oxidase family protein [Oharaeibacter diazotrophicus]|uniref:Pyridoxamine 5'-phosphate oxidase N-terminal domain-containing protein n=1 Tax=Oharaeibacter diazotrophicus TaxID=1920512 RepID=A0A4R6RL69_9HYPH|nr:pyridoxamine 5'-phosphate oxidase family protein [Oharaeibacter diazotrophicus]TDP87260.1 hypothetical protein EDD54_1149 [Oharaeibacter diazotrophicus]BBE70796.1 pyridoxamine 5'-phosphate oxidase [Pleomorphomonas sp. SM30]GLS77545.1 pyridoxamine 5'-phosphate oxidase [Oharaeibacter diazotrophicus]